MNRLRAWLAKDVPWWAFWHPRATSCHYLLFTLFCVLVSLAARGMPPA